MSRRHFWAEGYYVSTVGLNEATIKKYIQDQEKHDIMVDKLSVKEYEDPFRGGKDLAFTRCLNLDLVCNYILPTSLTAYSGRLKSQSSFYNLLYRLLYPVKSKDRNQRCPDYQIIKFVLLVTSSFRILRDRNLIF